MIEPAHIKWTDGTPVSGEFDDFYFSSDNGLEESRFVFLQHNQLADRWQQLNRGHFTIAETGFGTGLNFLCTWQLWDQLNPHYSSRQYSMGSDAPPAAKKSEALHEAEPAHLHFLSVEKFPLSHDSIERALACWPELAPYAKPLLDQYPHTVDGWHLIQFPQSRITLHLYFGDINDWLPQIEAQVDAWYLDGFTPSRNPDMWSGVLFKHLNRLTRTQGTVSTFTSARMIKDGLLGAGFSLYKKSGFGKKREMMTATQHHNTGPQRPTWRFDKPWFSPSVSYHSDNRRLHKLISDPAQAETKTALIIGAGISGCTMAYSLAQRGYSVTLVDASNTIASGASGNPQGVLYAKLSADMNLHSQFYLKGYLHSLKLLHQTLPIGKDWDPCGVLQLAFNEKEIKRQEQFRQRYHAPESECLVLDGIVECVSPEKATQLAGVNIKQSGLYFPDGGWVYPKAWCEALIQHPNIHVVLNESIVELKQNQFKDWIAKSASGKTFSAVKHCVVCSAWQATQLSQFKYLPTNPIAGQISQLPTKNDALKTVLCGSSYLAPSAPHQTLSRASTFGASYRLRSSSSDILTEDNVSNLENLKSDFPAASKTIDDRANMHARASVRCASPDYTPIVGAACDENQFNQIFSALNKNKDWAFTEPAPFLEGLYVNTGHGSRGLSSAPLCSELIAAQIDDSPWPLERKQANMLSPNRFLVKSIIKGV